MQFLSPAPPPSPPYSKVWQGPWVSITQMNRKRSRTFRTSSFDRAAGSSTVCVFHASRGLSRSAACRRLPSIATLQNHTNWTSRAHGDDLPPYEGGPLVDARARVYHAGASTPPPPRPPASVNGACWGIRVMFTLRSVSPHLVHA
jgi:hypothetical protein